MAGIVSWNAPQNKPVRIAVGELRNKREEDRLSTRLAVYEGIYDALANAQGGRADPMYTGYILKNAAAKMEEKEQASDNKRIAYALRGKFSQPELEQMAAAASFSAKLMTDAERILREFAQMPNAGYTHLVDIARQSGLEKSKTMGWAMAVLQDNFSDGKNGLEKDRNPVRKWAANVVSKNYRGLPEEPFLAAAAAKVGVDAARKDRSFRANRVSFVSEVVSGALIAAGLLGLFNYKVMNTVKPAVVQAQKPVSYTAIRFSDEKSLRDILGKIAPQVSKANADMCQTFKDCVRNAPKNLELRLMGAADGKLFGKLINLDLPATLSLDDVKKRMQAAGAKTDETVSMVVEIGAPDYHMLDLKKGQDFRGGFPVALTYGNIREFQKLVKSGVAGFVVRDVTDLQSIKRPPVAVDVSLILGDNAKASDKASLQATLRGMGLQSYDGSQATPSVPAPQKP